MRQTKLYIDGGIPRYLLITITIMAALTVANLHYNVPLLESISSDLHVSQVKANLITVFTQGGYAIGLLFVVALGDFFDPRRIISINFIFLVISLLSFAVAQRIEWLWASSVITGLCSVAVQMYIPMVSQYSKPINKSRNVGYIVSGLLIGVLMGRVLGGIFGQLIGWRWLYVLAAIIMIICFIVLLVLMPPLEKNFSGSYLQLLRSIFHLAHEYPQIIGGALCSSFGFASFNTLWACMAFHLAGPPFYQGSSMVGLLGLCGIASAIAVANIGKYVDRYGVRRFSIIGLTIMSCAWIILFFVGYSYIGLIIGVIAVDVGQQFIGLSNQSSLLKLDSKASNRINTIYMTIYFIGGSIGTFFAGQGWNYLGWSGVVLVGMVLLIASLITLISTSRTK
jgi:predicted MFS family arabinose efflux permease